MRRLSFFALAASAVCAVAFSPGPEILLSLTLVALTVAVVLAVPWTSFFSPTVADLLTGHGHISQANGLGVGGRHGWPHSIFAVMLAVCALMMKVGHLLSRALGGHSPARSNMSAQPLPS